MIQGACLCGGVRYELAGPLRRLNHCHCSVCRKHHGAPFASFVVAPAEGFRWTSGQENLREYASTAARVRRFCAVCGAVAPTHLGDEVVVPAGNLLGEWSPEGGMARHLYVSEKPAWHTIADALPRYAAQASAELAGEAPEPKTRQAPTAGAAGRELRTARRPATTSDGAIRGSCVCSAVEFAVKGPPVRWMQCHCSRCRRGRSAAHGSNAFYSLSQFEWLKGSEWVGSYRVPEALRFTLSFCELCGGAAPALREGVPLVVVPVPVLDGEPGGGPEAHIFTEDRACWIELDDELPRFAQLPPS